MIECQGGGKTSRMELDYTIEAKIEDPNPLLHEATIFQRPDLLQS